MIHSDDLRELREENATLRSQVATLEAEVASAEEGREHFRKWNERLLDRANAPPSLNDVRMVAEFAYNNSHVHKDDPRPRPYKEALRSAAERVLTLRAQLAAAPDLSAIDRVAEICLDACGDGPGLTDTKMLSGIGATFARRIASQLRAALTQVRASQPKGDK